VAIGTTQFPVPAGAAVQAFACFAGTAQNAYWIGDAKYSPNFRRLIFDAVDEELEVTKDFLFEEKKPRKEARDLESAVAWLLWMSGFAVLHPATKRLEDNVDLIALTPAGKVMLIECTTGLLSREGKLAALEHRIAALRKRLSAGGFTGWPILGVGVTTKAKDEVQADIREAATRGVLLLAEEDLRSGVERTVVPVNPESYFDDAVELVKLLSASGLDG
jgi:Holliday junction resolvase